MVPGSYLHGAGGSSPRARMLPQERPGPQSSWPKTSPVSTGEEPACLSCGFPVEEALAVLRKQRPRTAVQHVNEAGLGN